MKRLTYTKAHRLPKLQEELAAVPGLAPVEVPDPGIGTPGPWYESPFTIGSQGDEIELWVPDATDEQAVAAVVAAHDETTPSASEAATIADQTNERTLDERLEQQLPVLRDAITAITANPPTLFAGLSNQERVFLRRLARDTADLIKLRLRDLASSD